MVSLFGATGFWIFCIVEALVAHDFTSCWHRQRVTWECRIDSESVQLQFLLQTSFILKACAYRLVFFSCLQIPYLLKIAYLLSTFPFSRARINHGQTLNVDNLLFLFSIIVTNFVNLSESIWIWCQIFFVVFPDRQTTSTNTLTFD